MLRALVWKEWRQLRLMRWAGIALGALIPVAFIAGAEASKRGIAPLSGPGNYTTRELFLDLLPMALAFALWPLMALLASAQAFSGDRATGTEWFLLERPVPRRKIWFSKLFASSGTIVAVMAGTASLSLVVALATSQELGRAPMFLAAGIPVAALALFAGIAGASLLSAPIAAVLLGGILGVLPVVLTSTMTGMFPYARLGDIYVGMVVPWLLVPAYFLASTRALCRGEPAGAGRVRRAATVLAAALVVVIVLFLVIAPISVRINASLSDSIGVETAPGGKGAVLSSGWTSRSMWIVDPETGESLRFLNPPALESLWNADGTVLAVATMSGALGSMRESVRLEFYGPDGEEALAPIVLRDDVFIREMKWSGDTLVALVYVGRRGETELFLLRPRTGKVVTTGHEHPSWKVDLIGPAGDGRIMLGVLDAESRERLRAPDLTFTVHEIDTETGELESPPLVRDHGDHFYKARISPSGRYWIRLDKVDGDAVRTIVDLDDGSELEAPRVSGRCAWMEGDRVVWVERQGNRRRMFVAAPGERGRPIGEWADARLHFAVSPDGSAVLTYPVPETVDDSSRPDSGVVPGASPFEGTVASIDTTGPVVYDRKTGRITTVRELDEHLPAAGAARVAWAGPRTIGHHAIGVLAIESLDRPGELTYLAGGP